MTPERVTLERLIREGRFDAGNRRHHYGALIDGAHAGIAGRLDAIEATLEAEAELRTAE
jgi:hypothetical protein